MKMDAWLTALAVGAIMISATCIYQYDKINKLTVDISISSGQAKKVTEALSQAQARIVELEAMVERDDALFDVFLDEPWVREKVVHHRWYWISTGDRVDAFTQYPDPDIYYQLNY